MSKAIFDSLCTRKETYVVISLHLCILFSLCGWEVESQEGYRRMENIFELAFLPLMVIASHVITSHIFQKV
jgi:hypothetical protein